MDTKPKFKQKGRHEAKAERMPIALKLRQSGYSYRDIAKELNISLTSAWLYIKESMEELRKEVLEEADTLRQIELDRLDIMLKALWSKVEAGDEKAIDRVLKIQERTSKYLGLDSPTKQEIESVGDTTFKIEFVKDE